MHTQIFKKNLALNIIPILLLGFYFYSCSDKIQDPVQTQQTLLYSKPGIVDSLIGTCSTYLVRNFIIDSLDFSAYTGGKIEMNSFSNGDLSELSLFYLNPDTAVYVFNISGKDEINSQIPRTFIPSNRKEKYYFRMKLFASVCTGELYYLKVRDLNIYGVK
ncbi:MAG: hypothetical protein PHN88_10980 [Ignavibacteria bacterium]|nr:hypothetical protein [Ignavibacteria bacterium]